MNVQNRVRKGVEQRRADDAHKSGETDKLDAPRGELAHQRPVEILALRPAAMADDDGFDTGLPGAVESSCRRIIRDDDGDRRPEPAVTDGIDQRLQVAAAT